MEESGHLRRIFSGALIILIGTFISKLLSYGYRVIVGRIGTEQYGLLSLGLAISGSLIVISTLGLNIGVQRYVSYYKGKMDNARIKGVITSSLKILLPLSLFFGALLFALSNFVSVRFFHNEGLSLILKILAVSIPLTVLGDVFLNTIRAFQKVKYEVFTKNIGESSIKFILTFIFVYLGFGVVGASIAYVIAVFFTFLLSLIFVEKKIFPIFRTKVISIKSNKELVMYSIPLVLNTFVFLVILWTDTIMLGYFKNASDVGIYNAALPTAQLMLVIPNALVVLFLPILSELYAQEKTHMFSSLYKTITKWIFGINLALLIIFVAFSREILTVLFGKEYSAGSGILVLVSICYFVFYLFLTSNRILLALEKTKSVFYITLIGAVSNFVFNLVLIPTYGIMGAAIGTGASLIIMAIILLVYTKKITNVTPFKKNYIRILASGVLAFLIISWLKNFFLPESLPKLIIASLASLIIYLAILFVLGSFEKEDREMLWSIHSKPR